MNSLDFLALILAGGAVLDGWFNGSIFASWLGFFQVKAESPITAPIDNSTADDTDEALPEETLPLGMRIADQVLPRIVAELVTCHFCLSYHVSFWLAVICLGPPVGWPDTPGILLCKLPLYALAATRAGNLLNGLLPVLLKYERQSK